MYFALNLTETYLEVIGIRIKITEEIVVEVTGLPQEGISWFGRRTQNATAMREFLVANEYVCQARRGIALQ